MAAHKKREANDYYKLIVLWIKNCDKAKTFSARQIADDLAIENNVVAVFLSRKTKAGYLKKICFNHFTVINSDIPLQLSKGWLPDLVFHVLQELSNKYPKGYVRELFIKRKINNPEVSLNSIHSIIQRWHDQGVVMRNKQGKGVRLCDQYLSSNNRPLVSATKK